MATYFITLHVEVTDANELVAAAREYLIDCGYSPDEAIASIEEGNIEMALRCLIDGKNGPPPGTDIIGSDCEMEKEDA